MKIKKTMSSSDISLILKEFQNNIIDYSIDNIYELNDIYVFRLKGFNPDFPRMVSIVVEPGKRIHLTDYKRNFPQVPTDKVLTFRKFIKKGRITNLRQHGNDRIVVFDIVNHATERSFSLYCELFGKGNIILVELLTNPVDGVRNRVLYALWYRIMRDRRLLPGKEFIFPPTRGKSFLDITTEDLDLINSSQLNDQIVKVLVRNFGVSGEVVEEILAISGILKTEKADTVLPEKAKIIISSINQYQVSIQEGPPLILYENDGDSMVKVLPYVYASITGFRKEQFATFNKACDQYFSPGELLISTETEVTQKKRLIQLSKTLNKQEDHLVTLIEDAKVKNVLGNYIYENAHLITELFTTIKSANKKGMSWDEIQKRLEIAKQKNIASAILLEKLDYSNKTIKVNLSSADSPDIIFFTLDFTKTPFELGRKYYDKAKKAERKIEPAKKAIIDTKLKITDVKELKDRSEAISKVKAVKKRQRKWFEANHWTRTTNGMLVISGRDAKSNERLVRRYLDKNDIFFHADVQGASYTILKVNDTDLNMEESEPTEKDLFDAAIIAGVHSKAWKAGLGSVDVYSVSSDQVSFSAPSGEFIPKGGVIISGSRQYYKIPLKIWLGVYFDEIYAYLFISGNEQVIKQRTVAYVALNAPAQSNEKKGEIAKKIQHYFELNVPKEHNLKLKLLQLTDYVQYIP